MTNQPDLGEQRMMALISYILHLVGSITALPSLIALVINYLKRSRQLPLNSHHRWMIRTFWWTILWMILGWILMITVILIPVAWIIFGVAWLWWIYRHVRGLIVLLDGRDMPS